MAWFHILLFILKKNWKIKHTLGSEDVAQDMLEINPPCTKIAKTIVKHLMLYKYHLFTASHALELFLQVWAYNGIISFLLREHPFVLSNACLLVINYFSLA